ncbi:MAG: hypothetical protein M3373_05365 [Gemmatimonadota bacterium]|nr:hypothetical protein [Gemmatimonadota bacterium]
MMLPEHVAKSFPVARSIYWRPETDAYYLLARLFGTWADEYPIVVARAVLDQLAAQPGGAPEEDDPRIGLIGGEVCRCPDTGTPYVGANLLIPFMGTADRPARGFEAFARTRDALAAELRKSGREVLGWYRRRPSPGLSLNPGDERVRQELFPEAWQMTLIIGADGTGAFFRCKTAAARSYTLPFLEPLDEGSDPRTAMSYLPWHGYYRGIYHVHATPPEPSNAVLDPDVRPLTRKGAGEPGRRRWSGRDDDAPDAASR